MKLFSLMNQKCILNPVKHQRGSVPTKIVNGYKPLFLQKSFIVDVQLGSKYASVNIKKRKVGKLITFFKVLPTEKQNLKCEYKISCNSPEGLQ